MDIALLGVTGNMGQEVLLELVKTSIVDHFKLFCLPNDKRINKQIRYLKKHKKSFEVIKGNLKNLDDCKKIVADVDYVINMAAVIPPTSDKHPQWAIDCNQIGAKNVVQAIENIKIRQPKLIHISTVALYGNRNEKHMWGRVGDPLLVSPFDIYSASKLRGEFAVLESNIASWAILRQSAMLHKNMLNDNMHDGLMFHTCFNAPLEWVTAHDSGVLIANIIKKDQQEDLSQVFWKHVFNIGSVASNRLLGYDTLNDGFKLIGGSCDDFFLGNYNAIRNFHGLWFYDGHLLDDLFHYQQEDTLFYWNEILKSHKYFSLAKIVPKSLIATFAIKRLLKDSNSPYFWYAHHDIARMIAYFGGVGNFEKLPKDLNKLPLLKNNLTLEGKTINYPALKEKSNAHLINYYFDFNKKDEEITYDDLQNVAMGHGGKLLSGDYHPGNIYQKLKWETQDHQEFLASPYTILRAGHWYSDIYEKNIWDFDRLAKKDHIFAQIWYDSHLENEDYQYYYDNQFIACIKGKN